MELTLDNVKNVLLTSLKDHLQEVEAIGIFGSLARGTLTPRSDIDVFVVLEQEDIPIEINDMWWRRISDALQDFRRDVTVLVYSIPALKAISNWYVLRLASEGVIIYDKRNRIKELFKKIVEAAHKAGLVERETEEGRRVWTTKRPLKFGEIIEVKVED